MGVLAYQFPNGIRQLFVGEWKESSSDELPDNCFFICDFTKEKWYYFVEEKEVDEFEETTFFFSDKDEIFVVNGRFYLQGLQIFIDGFEENEIEKAVYSRIKSVEKENAKTSFIFHQLAKKYNKEAMVYLISDAQFGTWIGATPEVLVTGNEQSLQTMALAGTKWNEEIPWKEKEETEHQFVVDDIREKIHLLQPKSMVISPTKTVKRGAVYHLQTNFEFQLEKNKWKALILSLHPTPAVCGTPQEKAMDYILQMEPHERKFYTGLIGLKNKNELNIYVNLRCMQVFENQLALYVGGGITKDSDMASEWHETEAKSETILQEIFQNRI